MRKGHQAEVPSPGQNRRVPAFGAINYATGRTMFHLPKVEKGGKNSREFLKMFDQLLGRARRTGKRILLVIDNGPIHTAKRALAVLEDPDVRRCVQVIWLPKYAPELNDQEPVWKYAKQAGVANFLFQDQDSLRVQVREVLGSLNRKPKTLLVIVMGRHHRPKQMHKYLLAST